ncbi:hypothetical protein L1I79_35600 [Strepomyces sp. STD 3.1]|nr:hypothetical protein [Streptomyces sp. STD 3.1]
MRLSFGARLGLVPVAVCAATLTATAAAEPGRGPASPPVVTTDRGGGCPNTPVTRYGDIPPHTPAAGATGRYPRWSTDGTTALFPPSRGGSGHGVLPGTTELYRGGALVVRSRGPWPEEAGLPSATGPYRLVTTVTEWAAERPHCVTTRTEWSFSPAAPAGVRRPPPLPRLAHRLVTGTQETTRHDAELVVTPLYAREAPDDPVRTDAVTLSYDEGHTWRSAGFRETDEGGAVVRLDAPRGAAFLSLRVHAWSARGDSVTQTVVRASALG